MKDRCELVRRGRDELMRKFLADLTAKVKTWRKDAAEFNPSDDRENLPRCRAFHRAYSDCADELEDMIAWASEMNNE